MLGNTFVRQPAFVAEMDRPAGSGARSTMPKSCWGSCDATTSELKPMTMQSPAVSGGNGGGDGGVGGIDGDGGGDGNAGGGGDGEGGDLGGVMGAGGGGDAGGGSGEGGAAGGSGYTAKLVTKPCATTSSDVQ